MRNTILALALLISGAAAATAQQNSVLRLAVYLPDDHPLVREALVPFAARVYRDSGGSLDIQVVPNGWLGPVREGQLRLVERDRTEMALILPGDLPRNFPDAGVFELPLYNSAEEASRVAARLQDAGLLRTPSGYHVVSVFTSAPLAIHAPDRAASLAELQGRTFATTGRTSRGVLRALGIGGTAVPLDRVGGALKLNIIAGALAPVAAIDASGDREELRHHYLMNFGVPPMAIVMNRARYRALPERLRSVIDRNGGAVLAADAGQALDGHAARTLRDWARAGNHRLATPSERDREAAGQAWAPMVEGWARDHPNGERLLGAVTAALAGIRAGR